ncbi:hypothetical protein SAMN04487890_1156 [Mucilaginibacter polytrichastri]|nr:hypothetical protein SAMN04487890_1156 [Mucilaginibacter polytrichastri]
MCLTIIERETESKGSKSQERKRAALDDEFRSILIADQQVKSDFPAPLMTYFTSL